MKRIRSVRKGSGNRVSVKLAVFFMILLIVSWTVILGGFTVIGNLNSKEQTRTISEQAMSNINRNIDTLVGDVAYYSRIVLSSGTVTETLAEKDGEAQKQALDQFISLIDSETDISGIYMWDMENHVSSIDRMHPRQLRIADIKEVSWYNEVKELNGSWCLKLNADRALTRSSVEPVVSLIRMVNNPIDYQPIGLLMLNIPVSAFEECIVTASAIEDVYILDDTGKVVVADAKRKLPLLQRTLGDRDTADYSDEDGRIQIYRHKTDGCGWTILMTVEQQSWVTNIRYVQIIVIIAILILSGLCLISFWYTRRYVAEPLETMSEVMSRNRGNGFLKIQSAPKSGSFLEIRVLRDTYNRMIDEINELIRRIQEEERLKRLVELNTLQEQMKPHFLYNTIDAMGYLALSGKSAELYDALEAFGSYYRILLSKGREVISVSEEIAMVKDYLELQKIRYGDTLNYTIDAEERILQYHMLKMVLQPLVENAVNHGIRPKGVPGTVLVEGHQEEDHLVFTVEDDGVGMSEENLKKLQMGRLGENEQSFGLRGTMERLKIFYEGDIRYEIESEENRGTTVRVRIPLYGRVKDYEESVIGGR